MSSNECIVLAIKAHLCLVDNQNQMEDAEDYLSDFKNLQAMMENHPVENQGKVYV